MRRYKLANSPSRPTVASCYVEVEGTVDLLGLYGAAAACSTLKCLMQGFSETMLQLAVMQSGIITTRLVLLHSQRYWPHLLLNVHAISFKALVVGLPWVTGVCQLQVQAVIGVNPVVVPARC